MATKLIKVPKRKKRHFQPICIQIGSFIQTLSRNERVSCTKILEKIFKKLLEKIASKASKNARISAPSKLGRY